MANREQRRKAGKGLSDEVVNVTGLTAHFENGQYVALDISKVKIVDKDTDRPLFNEVLEPVPKQIATSGDEVKDKEPDSKPNDINNYQVAFDTPEGRMVYVKNGNWSGVRPAKAEE